MVLPLLVAERPQSDIGRPFRLSSEFEPAGDQPQAIDELCEGLQRGEKDQVLLGVTGSGKTFTMAHVIARTGRPAIILAPNKTLAAQLYGEMKSFFPENAVEYFVSYYDYYQPEAYVRRTDHNFFRGSFRVRGDTIELFPAHYEDRAWRLSLFGDEIEAIHEIDPLTGEKTASLQSIKVYANSHYVTPRPTLLQAIEQIKRHLKIRLQEFHAQGKLLEAQRLEQRTTYDLEMIEATGSCAGIENYSRYLTGRLPGQ